MVSVQGLNRTGSEERKQVQDGEKGEQDKIRRVRNMEYGVWGRKEGEQDKIRRVRSGRKENRMRRVTLPRESDHHSTRIRFPLLVNQINPPEMRAAYHVEQIPYPARILSTGSK
ncbi:MAG: hypothetical protein XE10_0215 [Methanoculleus marisnigri]|uniref:Uncharacterized protein n=1 Tax=Methanoculleus marisnigri TaxID=2198 RepID=A0A101J1S3_9EURY|nr:MAG: hypothetical protein XE10_0215 [Methanoculleus marisnigri]